MTVERGVAIAGLVAKVFVDPMAPGIAHREIARLGLITALRGQ